MKCYYDLHIHSALSPCGDDEMTPNNIVNMAIIKGLDAIAVTDHNSCGNVRAVMEAAGDRLLVVPGMEVETAEEVHVVCYFPTIGAAEQMQEVVRAHLPPVQNQKDIFGNQLYMNAADEVTGEEGLLLVRATTLPIEAVFRSAAACGGIAIPAHIDRSSYSVLSNLGFIPPELPVRTVEITPKNRARMEKEFETYHILSNSDAHYLEDIAEPVYFLDISSKNVEQILCKIE
ncbi:MAG TPA: PHP domain-containing protein [Candidatus Avimonoglobus intestinipullorum]|uniref:PHP domain-containing protein n=1 Tax=Candidatus Avimonoglobus intestinipullorum TaxID=2840699 RepID=A0A9D1LUD8_9FIRM|nr:PHP domain-containing protein [Candidatus Avimonoglobus intestinipullorum]